MTNTHPPRHIPFQGVSNFRDLGGYTTQDQRQLQWKKIYRSDRPSDFTVQDLQQFAALGIARSIDFRGAAEAHIHNYSIPQLQRIEIPIEPKVVQSLQSLVTEGNALNAATAHLLMEQTYSAFASHNTAQYSAFFDTLLATDSPILFHCTAGKDRTGFAAALLLEALGVDRATIMQDYLLTNSLYKRVATPHTTLPEEVLSVLWRVAPSFLDAAYQEIDQQYGSMPNYLRHELGLTPEAQLELKHRYLQPTAA
ncbi:tyrosine-protein phosphatase [Lampropedia puyangensis]|uniref:Tyrosine-protein phosphatase n=1 Tax=Lampropedia puyangensis TaxID=1330072 RepID=A0A4S8ESZ6_9BURK|nr:tyrosine-protein phosphatase [Lampropedia puyangensis]THT95391.1 tyrosine-protein phosphatase [Lampropedia puyangensis]